MRILDKSSIQLEIPQLGFYADDQAKINKIINMPDGVFLVTGPTGSGKTTSLYAFLNTINTPNRKIITVGALKTDTGVLNCSGRGPTRECVVKPDLFAPGYLIRSCSHRPGRRSGYYTAKSGTSMAAPVVCGAAALYLCKYPEASNTEVKLRLLQTALKTEGGKGERCLDVKHFLH